MKRAFEMKDQMKLKPTLEDLIGIEYTKLGFFREVQEKIAELHASNAELASKQRHIQAILDGITDVMAVTTLDLRIVSVNHVFHTLFGPHDPRGKHCHEVFRGQDHPCTDCPALIARDKNEVCRRLFIYSLNGINRHFETTASPLRNSEGKPDNILMLIRDVTLEKEYQAKYYQAENMAAIGILAAGVAHEINNPLTAISGFAEGLKRRMPRLANVADEDLVQDFNEYIGIILKECNRCRDIVQNLLTFSRQRPASSGPVSMNQLVRDVLKLLSHHLKQYPDGLIRLEFDDNLPSVSGDGSQLKQVILNLLINAIDATSTRGSIVVRTQVINPEWIGLAVEDTGCGIPSEHLPKLFEPFFTTKPAGKGVGIGLSTCYNIVRDHGGEIVVCSQEGEGSIFLVKLPRESCHGNF